MAKRYVLVPGDYVMLARHACWRMTKTDRPFVEVTGPVIAYFSIEDGAEVIRYEQWFHNRRVMVFLEREPEKHTLNVLRMRALGWRGGDIGTLVGDVMLAQRHLRVHVRNIEDEHGEVRERLDLRIFGPLTGVRNNDREAEQAAVRLFDRMPQGSENDAVAAHPA